MVSNMLTSERVTVRATHSSGARQQERTIAARRIATVGRLVNAGMPRPLAEGWIAAWEDSTAWLTDFRAAGDYWELGFQYALEERRRGYRPPEFERLVG